MAWRFFQLGRAGGAQRREGLVRGVSLLRIRVEQIGIADLDRAAIDEMWRLYAPHHNTTYDDFVDKMQRRLDQTVLFRDRATGELVGFTGLCARRFTLDGGRRVSAMYVGQTYIEPAYRGHNLVQRTVIRTMIPPALARPWEPLFYWSNCLSYKPYLLAARNLKAYYPSPDWPTPPLVRELIDALGETYYGHHYDPAQGVVRKR